MYDASSSIGIPRFAPGGISTGAARLSHWRRAARRFTHQLNAVDRTVAANHRVQNDFAGDALANQSWRILWGPLLQRLGPG